MGAPPTGFFSGHSVVNDIMERHETYMRQALAEAGEAARLGEVPVGAVLVSPDGEVVARAYNQPIGLNDPTAHAEILVLRKAAARLSNYRLTGHVLYVSLEPCVMCVGALVHARVAMVVYGAQDTRAGALESVYQIGREARLNHRLQVVAGVLADESRGLLQAFFQARR
jgi:tRNA(adenine34) deaminase